MLCDAFSEAIYKRNIGLGPMDVGMQHVNTLILITNTVLLLF